MVYILSLLPTNLNRYTFCKDIGKTVAYEGWRSTGTKVIFVQSILFFFGTIKASEVIIKICFKSNNVAFWKNKIKSTHFLPVTLVLEFSIHKFIVSHFMDKGRFFTFFSRTPRYCFPVSLLATKDI